MIMEKNQLEIVSEQDFQKIPIERRVIDICYARCFGVLSVANNQYGISWSSDLMSPKFLHLEKYHILFIGIDLYVVGINLIDGNISFKVGLTDTFSFFKENDIGFMIVTETTVTNVNGENCSISRFVNVPDIINDVGIVDGKLIIDCLDNTYEL